jgi:nucleotide-binding universal stress UspA family protein
VRVVLVPVADRPESGLALEAAFALAEALGANVVGCHVRPHREDHPARDPFLMPERIRLRASKRRNPQLDAAAAAALFGKIAKARDFALVKRPGRGRSGIALWKEMVGTPARVFGIIGPMSDLSILSRPKVNASGPAEEFLLSALLHSGKPVLVLPQKGLASLGRRVLIAWNQSVDAAAAVSAALPLLTRADEVRIVESGRESRPGPKATYLSEYLAHWGVQSERMTTPGRRVAREITETFERTDSDLLVMGAYSRQRLRELVFGGVTESMLFGSQLPVLMLHR